MPRMYSSTDQILPAFSFESFAQYYQDASVVATESISQYLGKAKDLFVGAKALVTQDQDKFVRESLGDYHEVQALAKEVKFADFRRVNVSRPEGFSELYIDYLDHLGETATKTHASVMKSIDTLKLAVAAFINEYQEGQLDSLYGTMYFEKEKKVIDGLKASNAKYFQARQNKTKVEAQDVIRSMTDFERIYPLADTVTAALNQSRALEVEQAVAGVTELIDALVEQNLRTGVLINSQGAKKELLFAIDQSARAVEFYTALHAEFFGFCSAFKTLTDALKSHK